MAKDELDRKIESITKRSIYSCLHNKSVMCDFNTDCEACGWFSEERDRRIEKFLKGNGNAVRTTRTPE